MGGLPDEDQEPYWLADSDPGDDENPLGDLLRPKPNRSPETEMRHPLLLPLSRALNAVARLETSAATASSAVAEGIRARTAYREAAGWLAHVDAWIHPNDLALRDSGLTGNYIAAERLGKLEAYMPSTATLGSSPSPPEPLLTERHLGAALRLARQWRRLAEFKTWRPLADAQAVREAVDALEWISGPIDEQEIEGWLRQFPSRHEVAEAACGRLGGARLDEFPR